MLHVEKAFESPSRKTILSSQSIRCPMIDGKLVGLRPLETEDVFVLFKWFNDERVLENLGADNMFFATSLEEERLVVESMIRDHRSQFLIIHRLEDHEPVGIIGLAGLDERNASAELRIVIGEVGAWDQGLGTDAVQVILEHGFNVRNLHRIWLRVLEYNKRALRCYEKCGFQMEGRVRQEMYHKGAWRDAYRMSILEEEFRGRERC